MSDSRCGNNAGRLLGLLCPYENVGQLRGFRDRRTIGQQNRVIQSDHSGLRLDTGSDRSGRACRVGNLFIRTISLSKYMNRERLETQVLETKFEMDMP